MIGLFGGLLIAFWSNMSQAGNLSSVTVTPRDPAAGEESIYDFTFTTSDTGNGTDVGIPADGKIAFTFPAGFDISIAVIANLTLSGGTAGGFSSIGTSGNTITLERDSTGSDIGDSTEVTVRIANIENSQTASNYTVSVETRKNDDTIIDSGTSAFFSISHAVLDHLSFNAISNKTAGTPFTITIHALDAYNNVVTNFTSSATLGDRTGTISPTSTNNFIAGQWTGNVTITRTYTNNTITATSGGDAGTSNTFNVLPGAIDRFEFSSISSPKTAGTAFNIVITAYDANDNVVTSFTDPVTLNDNTGTIQPTTTGSFTSGQWSGNVTITKKLTDVAITATNNGSGGQSNNFNVQAAALDHYLISNVSHQTAGVPFTITVRAQDTYNNTVDNFTGTVDISDLTGVVSPTTSGSFSNGVWSGDVTINQSFTNNIITVTRSSGGSQNGSSNGFNVNAAALDHFDFATISSPQTAGTDFTITITAKDANNNTITSFTETANLNDETATISPSVTGAFVNGVWSGAVRITETRSGNSITAISSGKSGTSNSFDVNAGALHHFTFSTVASPQTAGQAFTVTITAEDVYNNQVTSFNQSVDLDDNTGTLNPSTTGNFTDGQWSGSVSITQSQKDVMINADYGGLIGQSNKFNVDHSVLDNFILSSISTQAAGEPFVISVTARDAYNNRVESFTGTVSISDLSGTISPTTSGNFTEGMWSGTVNISTTYSNNRISVTRSGGSESGSSNLFDVVAGQVDHFRISNITSPKTAGTPFQLTITAEDVNNSTVSDFAGTVNLTDNTGTITPQTTGNFNNGVWSGDVTITKSMSSDVITVSGSGRSGNSNSFNVQAASVHHFTFNTIASPQTAGQNFSIIMTAKDVHDNTVTSFNQTVDLSDFTGTISPTTSGNFADGVRTQSVQITDAENNVYISANYNGASGSSNIFNVDAAALHHFSIGTISTQQAGVPFALTITARDEFNNLRTQFEGTVDITDDTGTISPSVSTNFSSGQWTDNVIITQAQDNNVITVQRSGGSESGTSNSFNVISSAVDHFDIATISSPQTAGVPFIITITAKDGQNNTVTSFTGTGTLSDESGTLTPSTTGSFSNGVWSGDVTITKSWSGNSITITSSGKAGTSNDFNVSHADLDHFRFATVGSPRTAGTPFNITLYAEDEFNNRVTSFSSYVNINDNTSTINPTVSGNFSNGAWSGSVSITKSANDVYITVSRLGRSGQSNLFNVSAALLDHFTIGSISTQAAGEPFPISVTAQDVFGNTRVQFTGTVNISDLTGTISPTVSGSFIQGQWTGNVVISQAQQDNQISVVRTGGTENGSSVQFDVISSTVDYFEISTISSSQTAGVPFNVIITAKDNQNNTVTDFSGTGVLTDETGSLLPTETGSFSGGVWSGSLTITESGSGNKITITSSGKAGNSNTFTVTPAGLDHFRFGPVGSPQEAGTNFSLSIYAEDEFNNRVTSFTDYVNLIESTGTISPGVTGNFSSGAWNGNVRITKSASDLVITASRSGSSGETNQFNVIAAPLHHFTLGTISTQAAGEPFTVSVTARDIYENVRTQFTSTVDMSDLTGTITPTVSGNFSQGQWTGNVVITNSYQNDQITVTRSGGSESGTSLVFDVISSSVDHFVVNTISSPQQAGAQFSITITAKDAQNNTVTDFNGTAVLSDQTGTITPTVTGNFNSGVWTSNITITKSRSNNTITVTSSGKAGTSNEFNVIHTDLDHFAFSTINSPQIAGSAFLIGITAQDRYDNVVTSFNSYVSLSEQTGTISPSTTNNFSNGQLSQTVIITKAQSDLRISAASSAKSGQSNIFNVVAGSLQSFDISSISTQATGEPFSISLTARDAYSNVAKAFTGTVDVLDLTGTVTPDISDNFSEGKWTGNVMITQKMTNNRITVTRTGGSQLGQSNFFNVISSDVDHFVINNISSPKTAGDTFSITITAEDGDNNIVDSFNGTATLSDFTNTISPSTTGNFSSGVWTGNVSILQSFEDNIITVTSSGKAGNSNSFAVIHNDLDHFSFASITSPQTAGENFSISVTAQDQYNNTVKNFVSTVQLTDNTTTISPTVSGNFTNGSWSGTVRITKSQNDVKITATGSQKTGSSNSFNIRANSLERFRIATINTQAAGEPFPLSVTALDLYNNVATSFSGVINISDLTGTISPTTSENFSSGLWTGNLSVTSVREDNRITVIDPASSKNGESNLFDVISSDVDHFIISNITSPKTAGVPFQITITAQDRDNNTATNFTGTVSITDITATLEPTSTPNFTAGVWTGNVKITKAKVNDKITATALGKAGVSNEFTVIHGFLDRFVIESIPSPQVAGNPFLLKITAKDSMDNTVNNFASYVNLSDNTNTISPLVSGNFTTGQWSGNIQITKSHPNVIITASRFNSTGVSNSFWVKPNSVDYLKITDAAGGNGQEIGSRTLSLDETLKLYASGFDNYNNYVRDVTANWGVTGELDAPSPLIGEWTEFDPQSPGTSGKIYADSLTLQADTTGTITVGSISFVKIRTAPGGQGVELADTTITADDEITLYCAGYDAGSNYIGDVFVRWESTGSLEPVVDDSSAWIRYNPTLAPTTGTIRVIHPVATDDETGTINVVPGAPFTDITLTPDPPVLPADGLSVSVIRSNIILDADSNAVAKNSLFTVATDLGTITSPDISSRYPGRQVAADDSGKISFVLQAPLTGGMAKISVSCPVGSATGYTNVIISSLNILSVNSTKMTVSQGQKAVPVTMTVENIGTSTVTDLDAELTFTGPAPLFENRKDDFPVVVRIDTFTNFPGGATRTLLFNVDVSISAHLDSVTIDGIITGMMQGSVVRGQEAVVNDSWLVQSPANVQIQSVSSLLDTVSQGQENVIVSMDVMNTGQATARVVKDTLSLILLPQLQNVTSEYTIISWPQNPEFIQGDSVKTFNFYVHVFPQATLGNVNIDGRVTVADVNTDSLISDTSADDSTHTWFIKEAPLVGIQSFRPSQGQVSQNQQVPWTINMKVVNNGGTAVRLDSIRSKFVLRGRDLTSEYEIVYDSVFIARGNDRLLARSEDSLKITILKTGSTLGDITVNGYIYLTDIGTGKPIVDETSTGITVLKPAQLVINNIIPSAKKGVTRNQGQDWTVKVVLENKGESDIEIKTNKDSTYISFSTGSDFTIIQPDSLESGGLRLASNSIDTLTFIVDGTGWNTGVSFIDAIVTGIEQTTDLAVQATKIHQASVVVEEPANIRILSVDISDAKNGNFVNTNQQISINVTVQNTGQDSVKIVYIGLQSDGATLPEKLTKNNKKMVKGDGNTQGLQYIFNTAGTPNPGETFYATIDSAVSENTMEPAGVIYSSAVDSVETLKIQTPAQLEISDIILPEGIRAGQVEPWNMKVVLTNNGQADLEVDILNSPKPYIEVAGVKQTDYSILLPDSLANGGIILGGGMTDTLIYRVMATGNNSGTARVYASATGFDRNSQNQQTSEFNKQLVISTSATIKLLSTQIISLNYDPESLGRGLVNRGQSFQVRAVLENKGRVQIDSIRIRLTSNGNSEILQDEIFIESIAYGQNKSVAFNINADDTEYDTYVIETFTAEIVYAIEHDNGRPVSIDNANSTAIVKIQEPAKLYIQAGTGTGDVIFTTNQNFVLMTQVLNIGDAETYDNGALELTIPDNYTLQPAPDSTFDSTNQVNFETSDILKWSVKSPASPSENDTFFVRLLSPLKDMNTQQSAMVFRSIDTLVVQTSSTELISTTMISEPEGATDDTLSTEQAFKICSTIQYSQNLRNVTATLILPSEYQILAGSDTTQVVENYVPIYWNVQSPANRDGDMKSAIIHIIANEVGNPQTKTYSDTLNLITVSRAQLELNALINGLKDVDLSAGQPFTISATVNNVGDADVIGEAMLKLNFGNTNCELNTQDTIEALIKPFESGVPVTWNAFAPLNPTPAGKITVTIHKVPNDENTNQRAYFPIGANISEIAVETREGGTITNDLSIVAPEGALDSVVSTYQEITMEAEITALGVKNIQSKLLLPPNFSFAPNVRQTQNVEAGQGKIVSWKIIAAAEAVNSTQVKVLTTGYDVNSNDYISSDTSLVSMKVVNRADVRVAARVFYPPQATDRIVSTGQEFRIAAYLEKTGDAEIIGNYRLEIELPSGYSTGDSLSKTTLVYEPIQWTIKAPNFPRAADQIRIRIAENGEPIDENTSTAAYFNATSRIATIVIITIEKNVTVSKLENRTPNVVAKNDKNVSMLGLELVNTEMDTVTNEVILKGLRFKLQDKDGNLVTNPAKAISRIAVVKYDDYDLVYGSVSEFGSGSTMFVHFAQPDTIWPVKPNKIDVLVDIAPDVEVKHFKVVVDSSSSFDIEEAHSTKIPIIKNSDGNQGIAFHVESDFVIILADNLKDSFGNYPNPFGSSERLTTKLTYYLNENTDVEIKIFTLLGELVWSRDFKATEPQGQQGMHDGEIVWDARNDKGNIVLNGVYVAYIRTGYGEETTHKIGVLK